VGRAIHINTVIAHHLIWTGYRHWLSNDPRGSGSKETRKPELDTLREIHHGRKRVQPSKAELKSFYGEAEDLLDHDLLWFDEPARELIAAAFRDWVVERGYTVWAFAILPDHAHAVIRVHRDSGRDNWIGGANASANAIRGSGTVPADHPVWSSRPYTVFKRTPSEVRTAVRYVFENPRKHRLPDQRHDWVQEYDGFPFHKKR
jgi:REP element-mobilizing transposase RayT